MNIIVPLRQVPDLVEELEIDSSGKDLDREWLKFKVNEFDDHALEEALCFKEENGGQVIAIALDGDDIDKALFAAAAKGADRVIKITGDFTGPVSSRTAAKALSNVISQLDWNLVFTGVQAVDERDGQVGILLAHFLNVPHVSVVTGITSADGSIEVHKEYGGGIIAEFEVQPPAVLGIQAARQTPRYVPVAKVRMAMRSTELEEMGAGDTSGNTGSQVTRMCKPESGGRAEMIDGSPDEIAAKLAAIIKSKA